MIKFKLLALLLVFLGSTASSQNLAEISGRISTTSGEVIPFANVYFKDTTIGASSNIDGEFKLQHTPGEYQLIISAQGYKSFTKQVKLSLAQPIQLDVVLSEDALGLDEVVISATRNRVKRRDAPVVVSTVGPKLFNATQSLSLADGLQFSPGLRVENNCQNCGFTQVRLNGLDGSYTQILVNSRPIFSSLLGVYGLEQVPSNIIDRVEVVRSGGSALYGSNAIAGTVNVITKDPVLNTWEIGSNLSYINGQAFDRLLNFNSSSVANDLKSGVTFFGNYRNRQSYDANSDGFTEIVELTNTTFGSNAYFKPNDLSRIGLNLTAIREYRRGGDRLDLAPQFTDVTEELDHDTFIGGIDYKLNSADQTKTLELFTSVSHTNRQSYYGGLGGGRTAQDSISANNAFGTTKDLAWVNGAKFSKTFDSQDVLTTGVDINHSRTEDEILGYNRLIDQEVNTYAAYGQYQWNINSKLEALIGARLDYIAVDGLYQVETISRSVDLDQTALSPRLTLNYKWTDKIRFRAGYARGFRAPQAFNEDLHVAGVGGEQQFVILSEELETEYSDAFTASINLSEVKQQQQYDVLVEGFYTQLNNPFTIISTGSSLPNGSLLEEVRNGSGARVYGTNIELKYSPNPAYRFQLGATYQQTAYEETQLLYEAPPASGEADVFIDSFVRNPDWYGFFTANFKPSEAFNIDLTGNLTGEMEVPRVVNSNGLIQLNESPVFFDLNLKFEKHWDVSDLFMVTLSGGVRNLFNSYQDDFDRGATRDSEYIYGPGLPRTVFVGLKFGKLH